MGEEFIVLIIGCLLIALAALVADTAAVYLMAAITCGLAITGYILTRIIAFPALADDVGNWFEPLGVVAIVAESVTVTVAVAALASRHRQPVSGTSCSALIREAASSTSASRSGQWR
jgi:hypothetical protein